MLKQKDTEIQSVESDGSVSACPRASQNPASQKFAALQKSKAVK
jgi:hypothetical protein